ncbi:MAG TPA: M12 family metallo-peptidase, partial [Phycisphaerae bacterium]|nr:M12 family metallo-peptidase [Phycisphaerae bacterium]
MAALLAALWGLPQAAHAVPQAMSIDGVWQTADAEALTRGAVQAWVRPEAYAAFTLDRVALGDVLATAPLEATRAAREAPGEFMLPMPDGSFARFRFVEAPVMAPELAAKYPEIRTFLGQGIDDPDAVVRFDITPQGFHAQVLSPSGAIYVDPLNRGDNVAHASYYKRDLFPIAETPRCTLLPNPDGNIAPQGGGDFLRTAETLRTYRLANAATGEYTQFHGGTVALGQAAIVTAINRVTGIYETELGIRMVLVANNDQLVYTNSSTDPYTNNDGGTMLGQNITNVNNVIGSSNYDIGHVFSTGGGGVAYLGVVCSSSKAGGVTGSGSPTGDAFWVDYVAHEMGHQFGANHSFNGVTGSCSGGNRNASTAYEPGSGSTIMAYAGICGGDDLQPHSDPYFHHDSFREIRNYVTGSGNSCASGTATGNGDPTVNAGSNYTIPANTPFELTAAGNDPNSDPITYCWEERDLGPGQTLSSGDNGSSPLFRSWNPTISPTRTFPRLSNLLNNTTAPGERLPTTTRSMNFRCTVRDNRAGGGGVGYDDMTVSVTAGAGPFVVTSPNGGEVWSGTANVTWNVAGTTAAPVSAANVTILLSTDGGNTFPTVLAASTPNDGSETVTVPNAPTSLARVKVIGTGNIFFDVSNGNFTIEPPEGLAITIVGGAPTSLAAGVPTVMPVQVIPFTENVVPGSPTLHYRLNGGAYATVALTPQGGNMYEAVLPRAVCTDTPEFYVTAQGDQGASASDPTGAPGSVYAPTVGMVGTIFADNFQTNQGWTTSGDATAGLWERGVPVNFDRGDPPADADGSGQCFLTDNNPSDSNSDVDNGTAILTSPVIDMSDGGTISYAYWLNDIPTGPLGVEDSMVVEVATNAAGTNWQTVRTYTTAAASWRSDAIDIGTSPA